MRRRLSLCSRGSALLSVGVQNEPLATLTWCSLLWSAPRYSLLGSVAAPALASLLLSVLLSLGAIAATPAHPQLGAIAATRSLCCDMGLPPGAPVAARCYAPLYCGAEGPLRPPPAPSLRVELPRVDPVAGRRWVSSPWGPGSPSHGAGFVAGRSATELSQFMVALPYFGAQPLPSPSRGPRGCPSLARLVQCMHGQLAPPKPCPAAPRVLTRRCY